MLGVNYTDRRSFIILDYNENQSCCKSCCNRTWCNGKAIVKWDSKNWKRIRASRLFSGWNVGNQTAAAGSHQWRPDRMGSRNSHSLGFCVSHYPVYLRGCRSATCNPVDRLCHDSLRLNQYGTGRRRRGPFKRQWYSDSKGNHSKLVQSQR